jgi:hypothetical protein
MSYARKKGKWAQTSKEENKANKKIIPAEKFDKHLYCLYAGYLVQGMWFPKIHGKAYPNLNENARRNSSPGIQTFFSSANQAKRSESRFILGSHL